jgi:hypothetical protein
MFLEGLPRHVELGRAWILTYSNLLGNKAVEGKKDLSSEDIFQYRRLEK